MKADARAPRLAVATGSVASLGAGVSHMPSSGRVLCGWVADGILLLEFRDQGLTWRVVQTPNNVNMDNGADEGVMCGLIFCDGVNVRLRNTSGASSAYRYIYGVWS